MGPEEVLRFWFPRGARHDAADRTRWFAGDTALDQEIRARFGGLMAEAASGAISGWAETPRGRLALILLLDQFPRNAFRGTKAAYAQDTRATALCLAGLAAGDDQALAPIERLFFCLPLLHAEDPALQDRSLAALAALGVAATGPGRPFFADWVRVARRQRWIIRGFGRFPHRNRALGRRPTPAERLLLAALRVRSWWR